MEKVKPHKDPNQAAHSALAHLLKRSESAEDGGKKDLSKKKANEIFSGHIKAR